jgi:polysaccharide biosynthesis protein PslG
LAFLKKFVLAITCLALLAAVSPVASATPPACTEYCYDPIPGGGSPPPPVTKPSRPDQDPGNQGSGRSDSEPGGTAGGSAPGSGGGAGGTARASETTRDRDLAEKLGVNLPGSGVPLTGRELSRVDPAAADQAGVGTSGIAMLVILTVLTVGTLVLVWRKGEGPAGLIRLGALGVVLIVLTFLGTGNAFAAKRAAVPAGFFGAITQSEMTPADAERLARGGNEMMRLPVQWHVVQPSPGVFNWSPIDAFVATAARAGMGVLPFLYDSPRWVASSVTTIPVRNARQAQAWRQFVSAAVDRYGPRGSFWVENGPGSEAPVPRRPIRNWQIWNESNFHYFASPVSPAQYSKLLVASSRAIKSRDPGAKIMISGLYGSPRDIPGRAMKSWKYLQRLYRLKANRHFDIVAVHPYTPNTSQLNLLMNRVRGVMVRNGDRSARLAITEIGWGSDRKTVFGKGTPAAQASQLGSAYTAMIRRRRALNLSSIYWFAVQDLPAATVTCNFCYSTGLFRARPLGADPDRPLVAKPAWNQYVRFSGGLR